MFYLRKIWLIPLLFLLAVSSTLALAADETEAWAPAPPRLSFIDGEVSYWRPGAEEWALARTNLPLAEGDALYSGDDANFEVQFGSRNFVRADANSQLSLVAQAAHYIQFELAGGRASFDVRSLTAGDSLEVSTPNAAFVIEHTGYYRVEVGSDATHFITRHGGEATVTTADGRSLSVYPSEDIVVTPGDPVRVATYAAPAPDDWDRWNDERSDRIGESISSRYLSADVYGAEELDHYGHWRVVPTYGAVWIPYAVSADWVPYSTGYWVWDPYYAWTWVDDEPWGWAPFHYGRWIFIDGYWAWAPGPLQPQAVYCPALVAFMVRDHDVSVRLSAGLPGLWWVALSWGEPVLPWWGPPHHRGHPWWGGWAGPRIVNDVVINQATVIKVANIHFHNARLPHAVLTEPIDKFGRERVRVTRENRYRYTDLAPVQGELPVKPTRASLFGGAPRGVAPPQALLSRPVVSTRRPPSERAPPWQGTTVRVPAQAAPERRYVIPPARRPEAKRPLPRPPFGANAGPERAPPPVPPRYDEMRRSVTPPAAPSREPGAERSPTATRRQATQRQQARPAPPAVSAPPARPSVPRSGQVPRTAPRSPPAAAPRGPILPREQRIERPALTPVPRPAQPAVQAPQASRPAEPASTQPPRAHTAGPSPRSAVQQGKGRPLPGQPANQTYRGDERGNRGGR
ncbi:MAG: DUF6600 domain-containing protein [Hyphomicrobiaceae bacterium]